VWWFVVWQVSLDSLGGVPLSSGAPHVIFIMVDDAGLNDIATTLQDSDEDSDKGAWSSDQYMPTLSSLARDGVVLSKYYGMHLCTPARGAFLTGISTFDRRKKAISQTQAFGLWGMRACGLR
jgi:hypothetical protein